MRRSIPWIAVVAALGVAPAAWAQAPAVIAPDPIEQSRELSRRPLPALPAAESPSDVVVPERRVTDPATRREVVVPAHRERRLSPQQAEVPPLPAYDARGGGRPVHLPGGERPPADVRQGP